MISSDPTLTDDIDVAMAKVDEVLVMIETMGGDIDTVERALEIFGMANGKVRGDWDYIKEHVHYLRNEFMKLRERQLTIIEGPPPPPMNSGDGKDRP